MSPQDFIESIEIDDKGPLSHFEDGPYDTSDIKSIQIKYFRIQKKYIQFIKHWHSGVTISSVFFLSSKWRQIVREMTRDNTLNIHVLITQSIPQDK